MLDLQKTPRPAHIVHAEIISCRILDRTAEALAPASSPASSPASGPAPMTCDCGAGEMKMIGGCYTCLQCGSSKCEI